MRRGRPEWARPSKPQYVVKLAAAEYRDFAKWMTTKEADGIRRYQAAGNLPSTGKNLDRSIEDLLDGVAEVYEDCTGAANPFNATAPNKDNIIVSRDNLAGRTYPVAVPEQICETNDGDIDLDYLKSYVESLKLMSDDDAAYALLGMYFISRCR